MNLRYFLSITLPLHTRLSIKRTIYDTIPLYIYTHHVIVSFLLMHHCPVLSGHLDRDLPIYGYCQRGQLYTIYIQWSFTIIATLFHPMVSVIVHCQLTSIKLWVEVYFFLHISTWAPKTVHQSTVGSEPFSFSLFTRAVVHCAGDTIPEFKWSPLQFRCI